MKKQLFLCVDLRTRLQNGSITLGEGRKGMLTMTEEGEQFEFDEALPEKQERNPKLWQGNRLNVHKNRHGELVVSFRRTLLTQDLDPCHYADLVFLDLERAKAELGL